jgi:hypothetical protein
LYPGLRLGYLVVRVSRNASSTESATLLAIYIAPKGAMPADLMEPLRQGK